MMSVVYEQRSLQFINVEEQLKYGTEVWFEHGTHVLK